MFTMPIKSYLNLSKLKSWKQFFPAAPHQSKEAQAGEQRATWSRAGRRSEDLGERQECPDCQEEVDGENTQAAESHSLLQAALLSATGGGLIHLTGLSKAKEKLTAT